jgi:hypothetical protein
LLPVGSAFAQTTVAPVLTPPSAAVALISLLLYCSGDRATMNSGKMVGRVLLGGKERNLNKFRQISAHVKQVG